MHHRFLSPTWLLLAALALSSCGGEKTVDPASRSATSTGESSQENAGGQAKQPKTPKSDEPQTGQTGSTSADDGEKDTDNPVDSNPTTAKNDAVDPDPVPAGEPDAVPQDPAVADASEATTPQEVPAVGPTPGQDIKIEPFVFDPPLPTISIGNVNGEDIPASRLLELVLEQNFNTGVNTLVMGKIMEIELANAGLEITDDDVQEELEELVQRTSPGKTVEEVLGSGQTSSKHLRESARTQRGWKMLFWKKQNIEEDQRDNEANPFLMQFFMRQAMQNYDQRLRGRSPAPTPPYVAQVTDRRTGTQVAVNPNEALDLLIGLVRQSALVDLQGQLLEQLALTSAMSEAGVEVAAAEVEAWAQAMHAKHQPPFTWDQVCRLKGTSPEREKQRWARIQGWKRMTDAEVTEEEVNEFLAKNKGFFLGHTKKVSHILVRTADEVTGMSLGAEAEKEAKARIDALYRKAMEGLDFGWLAKTYSDDNVTARGEGRLAQGVKQWGGALDPAFRDAAWALSRVGDISPPIRSQFGWHVIKLDEYSKPTKQEPDWKAPRYWEWVVDEYETKQMEAWFEDILAKAKIQPAPAAAIFSLKERSYVK